MLESDLTIGEKDEAAIHFESLCTMVDHLESELTDLTARRDTCKKCK